eukprot:gene2117-biopygen12157
MNMEPPPLQNQLPFYVTQEQFVACELRIMQRMHQHLNDINDMRDELIAANMHMQQQINDERDAVRALEHRVNAGMTMNSSEELYECHRFLCQCAEWAAGGAMHQQYMNFMGDANHWRVPGRSVHLGTGLWCYRSPWWELAKAIITDTSAELLLLGRRTA